jgi:signal transduction histidine kinase
VPSPALAAPPNLRLRSGLEIWAISFAAGLLTFLSVVLAQWLVYVLWLGKDGVRYVGGIVAAVLMTLLIQRQLSDQRRDREAARRRFELIAEMNHHIRNALQAISYERYSAPDEAASLRLKEAVERIQWVLEEILPGVQKR